VDLVVAAGRLDSRGFGLPATYLNYGFTSDGAWTPVADEVQADHGRMGPVVVCVVRHPSNRCWPSKTILRRSQPTRSQAETYRRRDRQNLDVAGTPSRGYR
jgi:hypothetical protein